MKTLRELLMGLYLYFYPTTSSNFEFCGGCPIDLALRWSNTILNLGNWQHYYCKWTGVYNRRDEVVVRQAIDVFHAGMVDHYAAFVIVNTKGDLLVTLTQTFEMKDEGLE
jgi:hypothetical protein